MDLASPAPTPSPGSPPLPERQAAPWLRPAFALGVAAGVFAALAFAVSWWRWWTFKYHTFDLAFYVQGLWLALRGEWQVSLLHVPLLGNHAEPIVLLLLPLFAICPHPMLLVAVQVGAMATLPFTAWRIAKRLGLGEWRALGLALATLAAPATGYVAIHEFHPEAFSAPLFLLMMEARLAGKLSRYWIWFALALGCKENIALVLVVWSIVEAWGDRGRGWGRQWKWNLWPAVCAAGWIAAYAFLIGPALNGGQVDYGNLYAGLSSPDAGTLAGSSPERAFAALWQGVTGGNLVWAMILSFAGLSLLRPRWLLIAAPLFLQHLLSARTSEWQIYFHYAAPLIPLLWFGAAEAVSRCARPDRWAFAPLAASLILQPLVGPVREIGGELESMDRALWSRSWKAPLVEELARDPSQSISAGLPFLSHLATRRELYSIHFVIKGLKTLSRRRYEPAYEPDAVLIDFADEATFGKAGGYYHPQGMIEGAPLPPSDELLNRFLARDRWISTPRNAVLLLRRSSAPPEPPAAWAVNRGVELFPHTRLEAVRLGPGVGPANLAVEMEWRFNAPRTNIPWLKLELISEGRHYSLPLGMCAPEAATATHETKEVLIPPWIVRGRYKIVAVYYDEVRALWGKSSKGPVLTSVQLGEIDWPGE